MNFFIPQEATVQFFGGADSRHLELGFRALLKGGREITRQLKRLYLFEFVLFTLGRVVHEFLPFIV